MSSYRIETRDDNGRIAAVITRNGNQWKYITSNGERPFKTHEEARAYARQVIKRSR